jgi:hypothetical protein
MSLLLNDRKLDESKFNGVEDLEEMAAAGFTDIDAEKEQLLSAMEKRSASHRRKFPSGCIPKLLIAIVVGSSCIALIWMLHHCLSTKELQQEDLVSSTFRLVKDAVSASTSGITEDFQVYQPVFTPSGATDETTLANGSENTTTVAQTNTTSSCQVVLMEHVFAFSYGLPFVG